MARVTVECMERIDKGVKSTGHVREAQHYIVRKKCYKEDSDLERDVGREKASIA